MYKDLTGLMAFIGGVVDVMPDVPMGDIGMWDFGEGGLDVVNDFLIFLLISEHGISALN